MKKSLSIALASLITLGIFSHVSFRKEEKETEAYMTVTSGFKNHDGDTYYNGIDDSLSGEELQTKLRDLNSGKRQKFIGYDDMGTSAGASYYIYTDYDDSNANDLKKDSNGQVYGTRISSFYTYTSVTGFNREHVWPNTHGGGKGCTKLSGGNYLENDIHMTRPTISTENSSRGHSFYVEGMASKDSTGWDPYAAGYSELSRGEAARIILYGAMADSRLSLVIGNSLSSKTNNLVMGDLETIMKWNCEYPVTQREKNRNEGAEYLQGNRNPFVDHPSYACRIYSGKSSKIANYCASADFDEDYVPPVDVPVVDIYKNNNGVKEKITSKDVEIEIQETIDLYAYVDGTQSEKCSWEFNGNSVINSYIEGNGRKITGLSEGTTILKVGKTYYDENNEKQTTYKEINIVVRPSGGSSDEPPIVGNYRQITSTANLNNGDYIVLATNTTDGVGITGVNSSSKAAFSTDKSKWVNYRVEVSGASKYLYDTVEKQYIAKPTSNSFSYGDKAPVSIDSSTGVLMCNNRYLVKNGEYIRFYSSISSYTKLFIYKVEGTTPITKKTLTGLELSEFPLKLEYNAGDIFDPTGAVIIATFSDGDTQDVTSSVEWTQTELAVGQSNVAGFYTYEETTLGISVPISVIEEIPPIIDDDPPVDEDDDDDEDDPVDDPAENEEKNAFGCTGSLKTSAFICALSTFVILVLFRKRKLE